MTSSDETWRIERDVLDAVLAWCADYGNDSTRGEHLANIAGLGTRLQKAAECDAAFVWIERTWRDVRQGDMIRPVGMPQHAVRVENIERHSPGARRFTMRDITLADVTFTRIVSNPDGAIEIRLTNGEAAAINMLGGWKYREGVMWDA